MDSFVSCCTFVIKFPSFIKIITETVWNNRAWDRSNYYNLIRETFLRSAEAAQTGGHTDRQTDKTSAGPLKCTASEVLNFIMVGFITLYFPLKQEIAQVPADQKWKDGTGLWPVLPRDWM